MGLEKREGRYGRGTLWGDDDGDGDGRSVEENGEKESSDGEDSAGDEEEELDSWELAWRVLGEEEKRKKRERDGAEEGRRSSMGESATRVSGALLREGYEGLRAEKVLLGPAYWSQGRRETRTNSSSSAVTQLLPSSFSLFGALRTAPSPPLSFHIHTGE